MKKLQNDSIMNYRNIMIYYRNINEENIEIIFF